MASVKEKMAKNVRWMKAVWIVILLMSLLSCTENLSAATFSTTTVQGTAYLANGTPGSGTLVISWPSFTTSAGQLVVAGRVTKTISADGFVSVSLAPNAGATPAGQYYTAVYSMSDGTTSTQYWVVPTGSQATLAAVQSQVMPSSQAVQTVSKTYVDTAISVLTQSLLTDSGGTLTGPLYLNADPTAPLQAATKHYVDINDANLLPITGGTVTGSLTAEKLGAAYQVDQFTGSDFGAQLSACISSLDTTYGGTCDARNYSGALTMAANVAISTANATVWLPCATITTAKSIVVTAGTRNVTLHGCGLRGSNAASGSTGGTVFQYTGTGAMISVGDSTYAANTMGFHLDNVVINTTGTTSAAASAIDVYRTQEMELKSLYLLGNSNQTAVVLDGTGNYTGGSFYDLQTNGFAVGVSGIGHQMTNSATTDWLNASTFVRLHINCPTSSGSPIAGTIGIDLQAGDGNTFTGGDVEGCATALHLGASAKNNTVVGLRNENSTKQVVADSGSAYNSWITGGTMFTGALTDNGTRNSFLDTFHRSFNGLNGDWYGSQSDATVTDHYRLGIGSNNERGHLARYQTDYGYRWTTGLSDAASGEQFYQILDELNSVYRLSIGQYNSGQSSTNNQTVINSAGTGAVVLNGSNNAGTGGVVIGSGGTTATTVATIDASGNAQFMGSLQVSGATTLLSTPTVKNQADAEIDATLWAGKTAAQKESFIYKDWNGTSQWYMVKDASNNWALNSAIGGLDSFKAYQSTNSGDTYVNASNATGAVRVNYESGSGTAFNVYGGSSTSLYASFTGTTAIKFPGLAASSGKSCLQIDNSGYLSNTGTACGSGSGTGTVSNGSAGQLAYYAAGGTTLSGLSTVPLTAGGTGAATAAAGLANLGGVSTTLTTTQSLAGRLNLPNLEGTYFADQYQSPTGTGNNGIANALTACGTAGVPCRIVASPGYSTTETELWTTGAPAYGSFMPTGPTSSQAGGTIEDWRLGVPHWMVNATKLADARHMAAPEILVNNTTSPTGIFSWLAPGLTISNAAFAGGRNSYADKTNLANLILRSQKNTQAQNGGDLSISSSCYGNGDCVGTTVDTLSYGSANTSADEGNETARWFALEGGKVFGGTITSIATGSDGTKTVVVGSQSYGGTQGEGRLLVDLTSAYNGKTNGSYIASITSAGQVTCGGSCNWDTNFGTSTTTTLTTEVSNTGSTNTFPQTNVVLAVASSSGFTAGKLACIFDYDYECEQVSAVGSGTITVPILRVPHPAGSIVVTGGLTGYGFEAEADRASPSALNGLTVASDAGMSSLIRYVIPVMSSQSGNVLTLFAGYNSVGNTGYTGRAYPQMGSGGTVSLTITSGVVTSCSASGGSGYSTSVMSYPPQVTVSGSWTTAPSLHVSTSGLSGGIGGCVVDSGGSGVTSATATVVPTNPYDLYAASKVRGVYNASAGSVDGTLSMDPPSGSFAVADQVEQPHYFQMRMIGTRQYVGSVIPSTSISPNYGILLNLSGMWQGSDAGVSMTNTSDPTVYAGYIGATPWVVGRGSASAPNGLKLSGGFANGVYMTTPPMAYGNIAGGVVEVGCGSLGCTNWTSSYPVLYVQGNGGNDSLGYNPSTRVWSWTGNVLNLQHGSLILNQTGYAYANGSQAVSYSATIPATVVTPTAFCTLTDASTVTLATGGAAQTNGVLTLNHATTTRVLNVTGLANGASFTVVLKQDTTGGAALTLGSGCTWYLGGNSGFTASTTPALTSTASGVNILSAIYDGTNCYANVR